MIFFDVDTQHDFMDTDGALAVPDAQSIRSNIEALLTIAGRKGIATISSRCAHDQGDPEFKIFPPHCIEGTRGAERIFAELPELPREVLRFDAAADPDARIETGRHYIVSKKVFDLFSNAWLDGLRRKDVFNGQECIVFGVATDYCVRACGLGLAEAGAKVYLVEDAVRGVATESTSDSLQEMRTAGVQFTTTDEVIKKILKTGNNQ